MRAGQVDFVRFPARTPLWGARTCGAANESRMAIPTHCSCCRCCTCRDPGPKFLQHLQDGNERYDDNCMQLVDVGGKRYQFTDRAACTMFASGALGHLFSHGGAGQCSLEQ